MIKPLVSHSDDPWFGSSRVNRPATDEGTILLLEVAKERRPGVLMAVLPTCVLPGHIKLYCLRVSIV